MGRAGNDGDELPVPALRGPEDEPSEEAKALAAEFGRLLAVIVGSQNALALGTVAPGSREALDRAWRAVFRIERRVATLMGREAL